MSDLLRVGAERVARLMLAKEFGHLVVGAGQRTINKEFEN